MACFVASSSSLTQEQGRIEPILTMAPEEAKSQPLVMVNVYTRGLLSGGTPMGRRIRRIRRKRFAIRGNCVKRTVGFGYGFEGVNVC